MCEREWVLLHIEGKVDEGEGSDILSEIVGVHSILCGTEHTHTHTHSLTHSHTHTHTHSLSLIHSLTHSLTHTHHTHTHTHTHTLTHTLTHSLACSGLSWFCGGLVMLQFGMILRPHHEWATWCGLVING